MEPRTDLSLIGTGLLGAAIAQRFLACGRTVTVHNRSAARAHELVSSGARWAESIDAAVDASPVTLTVLRDGPISRQMLAPARDRLAGKTVIQMATVGPDESERLRDWLEAAGADPIEAPVLGSRPQAHAGTLQVLVGARERSFERWRPLLADLGSVQRIGELPTASWLKLALNQLIASHITGLSVSLGMVRRSGVGVEPFLDILRASSLHAASFDNKLPRLLEREFDDPNFPAELMLKDIELARDACRHLGVATATLEAFGELYRAALAADLDDGDYSSVVEVVDPREPSAT